MAWNPLKKGREREKSLGKVCMESRDTLNTKKERERDRNESRAIWEKGASERERVSHRRRRFVRRSIIRV